jgi:hypothetical protein
MPVTAVAAGALVVVFAMAVAGKVSTRSFTRFRRSAAALWPGPGRLPTAAAVTLATAVLLAEAAVAGGLLLWLLHLATAAVPAPASRPLFGVAVALLAAFTAAQALALRRGTTVTCACFGRADTPVSRTGIARNITLIALGLLGTVTADRPGTTALSLICAIAGGVAGLILASLEDIVSLLNVPQVPAKGARR